MNNLKKTQSGRSMVEMLGVLAIIAIISIGSIASMSYIDSYYRTSATQLEIDNLANKIQDLYSWSADFSALSMTTICAEVLDCTTETNDDGTVANQYGENKWGGKIDVAASDDKRTFVISYTEVPKIPCERLNDLEGQNVFKLVTLPDGIECSNVNTLKFTYNPQ